MFATAFLLKKTFYAVYYYKEESVNLILFTVMYKVSYRCKNIYTSETSLHIPQVSE